MKYPKVIYLGGAPMLGKTTVARILAGRLGYCCIPTDDIGIAIGSVTTEPGEPEIDYREYYIKNDIEALIQDVNRQHERMWPALRPIILSHARWGHPAVIEGWALRPANVQSLSGDISGLFLLADNALIEKRVRSSDFSEGASDVDLMVRRYCERSYWYNAHLREDVARFGLKSFVLTEGMLPENIADACMELLI